MSVNNFQRKSRREVIPVVRSGMQEDMKSKSISRHGEKSIHYKKWSLWTTVLRHEKQHRNKITCSMENQITCSMEKE